MIFFVMICQKKDVIWKNGLLGLRLLVNILREKTGHFCKALFRSFNVANGTSFWEMEPKFLNLIATCEEIRCSAHIQLGLNKVITEKIYFISSPSVPIAFQIKHCEYKWNSISVGIILTIDTNFLTVNWDAFLLFLLEFFLNESDLSLNSANSRKLINHWSMNWAQFKDLTLTCVKLALW